MLAFRAFLYRIQSANLTSIARSTLGALGHEGTVGETDAWKAAIYTKRNSKKKVKKLAT